MKKEEKKKVKIRLKNSLWERIIYNTVLMY